MRKSVLLILSGLAGLYALGQLSDGPGFTVQAEAQSPVCGTTYRVSPGDTLQGIAFRAYGTGDYQRIFAANRDVLVNPAKLTIGDELTIPCRNGTSRIGTATGTLSAARETGADVEAVAAASGEGPEGSEQRVASVAAVMSSAPLDTNARPIRFLTGSNFAPFVHADLPGNGMAVDLVQLAMETAAPRREVSIILLEDWTGHLDLLEGGTYDVGFPWYRPDCARADRLSATMRQRCANFDFSAPLFEIAIGYYVRSGHALADAAEYSSLAGQRICRPANHFTFDLEQEGLTAPGTTLIFPASADDCFALLDRGAVDVVTLNRPLAESAVLLGGLLGKVDEIRALASVQTLHAITAKANPNGPAILDLINAGQARLVSSGRKFEVESAHLGAFGMRLR
jgi:polar amino acid transport system substrate-binding protein